ncbi:MAG: LysM peptidoglycan-binding domain-containing protein [Gammaproteobacteria bacterium]|nr:LysM peptidoglycan-binding domain-containing protein [Gammaproteobacteria bacterium]
MAETAPASSEGQYSVVKGDNLWNISAKPSIYNNPYQWPLIYKANSGKIKDADLIYPGQVFDINTNPTAAEVDAAVHHAKTRGAWSLGKVEESDKAYLAK